MWNRVSTRQVKFLWWNVDRTVIRLAELHKCGIIIFQKSWRKLNSLLYSCLNHYLNPHLASYWHIFAFGGKVQDMARWARWARWGSCDHLPGWLRRCPFRISLPSVHWRRCKALFGLFLRFPSQLHPRAETWFHWRTSTLWVWHSSHMERCVQTRQCQFWIMSLQSPHCFSDLSLVWTWPCWHLIVHQ